MDDITLQIQRVLDGDVDAFGSIVRHYQSRLFAFLGRMGLSQGHCEDIAQDTFVRAMRHLHRFDQRRATFTTWLFTIARNLALSHIEREARRPTSADPELSTLIDPGASPLQMAEHSELLAQLRCCMSTLEPADRTVLALAYDQGFSSREAAAIAQCSDAAFRTRLHRARSKLKNCLEQADAIE